LRGNFIKYSIIPVEQELALEYKGSQKKIKNTVTTFRANILLKNVSKRQQSKNGKTNDLGLKFAAIDSCFDPMNKSLSRGTILEYFALACKYLGLWT
jgi:hypothetical protein